MGKCGCNEVEHQHSNVLITENEVDDVWADEELIDSGEKAIKRSHTKQGYVDGLTKAKEHSLQKGFDDGYPLGAKLAIQAGFILAQSAGTENFDLVKKDVKITNILQRQYFDDDLNLKDKQHPILQKWQQEKQF